MNGAPDGSASNPDADAQTIDKELAIAFKRGEDSAYAAIYERHHERVEKICRRMLGNPRDAEEASQETFIRVYQGLARFNGRYQLGAWVARIASNVCLDAIRSRQRRPVDPTADVELFERPGSGRRPVDPETAYLQSISDRQVLRVLKTLSPLHMAVILLRDVEGLAYCEIAETLDLSESQIKALLHRARKRFRSTWRESIASMLVPAGLFERMRRIGDQARESAQGAGSGPAAQLAQSAPSFTSAAASCSGVLQQCGQFVTERAATVVAAVVVGGAAAGSVAVASLPPAPPSLEESMETSSVSPSPTPSPAPSKQEKEEAQTEERPQSESASEPQAEPEPPEPAASPAPQPSPTPVANPTPTAQPSPTATKAPDPPKEPQGFRFSADSLAGPDEPCACVAPTVVDDELVEVDEDHLSYFRHWLRGSVAYKGVETFGLKLRQASSNGSDHSVSLTLYTDEGAYMYETKGALEYRGRTEWGGLIYRYGGTYKLISRPTMTESVPEQGRYMSEIVFSWRDERIVSSLFSIR